MRRFWTALGDVLERRRWAVLGVIVLVTVVLAAGLPRLTFETSQSSLVSADNAVSKANERYQRHFGGEAMFILYGGDVTKLFSAANYPKMVKTEAALRATKDFAAVVGPVTALQFAKNQLSVAPAMLLGAADRASDAKVAEIRASMATEMARLGAAGPQTLTNPKFVDFLLFDASGQVRPLLRDNFPDAQHALTIARLHGNMPIADQAGPAAEVKRIAKQWPPAGFTVLATGVPSLLTFINDYLQGGMATLGLVALVVMIVLLFFVFRVRWRLLPLGVVLVGLVWAFGAMGYLGIPLTMVTISGLPIMLGLGVDFAIQMQNRFEEELLRGRRDDALRQTIDHMAPPLAVAMVAAIAGFAALQLSQVPLIRQFGVMLCVGTAALVAVAILVPVSALAWRERRHPTPPERIRLGQGALERGVGWMTMVARPVILPLAALAVVVIGLGLVADSHTGVQTEPERWVAQSSTPVRELSGLRAGTGSSSELDLLVEADDVTSTEVVAWMQRFAEAQVRKHPEAIARFTSMPAVASAVTGASPVQSDMQAVIKVAPADVKASFVLPDRTAASIVFPMKYVSLDVRAKVVEAMERDLASTDLRPPAGVRVTPAGLAVVGIELMKGLTANRAAMTLLSIAAVALWLLIAYRRLFRVVLPLVPVLFAVGLSSGIVWLMGWELTPLTTVVAPLAIAVTTEFSVLIMARYLEEREAGRTPEEAVRHGAVRIGRAFVASGLTLFGGFAVLSLSPLPLLGEFGVVVALIVLVALVASLTTMPPLLVWHDRLASSDAGALREVANVRIEEGVSR